MIESFRNWIEEKGLADLGFADPGTPKIKNKILNNKDKIPNIPTNTFEKGRGIASKLEAQQVGEIDTPRKKKTSGIPKYTFDVDKITATRLDPGS